MLANILRIDLGKVHPLFKLVPTGLLTVVTTMAGELQKVDAGGDAHEQVQDMSQKLSVGFGELGYLRYNCRDSCKVVYHRA